MNRLLYWDDSCTEESVFEGLAEILHANGWVDQFKIDVEISNGTASMNISAKSDTGDVYTVTIAYQPSYLREVSGRLFMFMTQDELNTLENVMANMCKEKS